MSAWFMRYAAFVGTLLVIENVLFDVIGPGTTRVVIALAVVGLIIAAYGFWLYKTRTPKVTEYPSTVRARIAEGVKNGVTKR